MTRRRRPGFTQGLAVAGRQLSPRPLGGGPPGASAAAHGTPGDRPLRSPPYPAAAPASTTTRPTPSRRMRRKPRECHSQRAGTPRIVRAGPSSVKGTLRFADVWPPLSAGASASPAGLTARARPEARPEMRAANLIPYRGWALFLQREFRMSLSVSYMPQAETPASTNAASSPNHGTATMTPMMVNIQALEPGVAVGDRWLRFSGACGVAVVAVRDFRDDCGL